MFPKATIHDLLSAAMIGNVMLSVLCTLKKYLELAINNLKIRLRRLPYLKFTCGNELLRF